MKAVNLNKEIIEQYIKAGAADAHAEQLRVLAEHHCDKIRLRVAENPKTPADVLWSLSQDPNHDVRIAVAANPSCESTVRSRLAQDSDVIVRHGMAQNISTPAEILRMLADDDNGWVRGEAIRSLEIITSRSGDEMASRRQLRKDRALAKIVEQDQQSFDNEAAS